MRPAVQRLGRLGTLAMALVAVIGLAHTPGFRPVLGWAGTLTGCPVSLTGGNAQSLEAYRAGRIQRRAGSTPAAHRPALGFSVGSSSRAVVEQELQSQRARCERISAGAVLRCSIAAARGDTVDVHLQFDPTGTLVAVDVWHDAQDARAAAGRLQDLERQLRRAVGPPTAESGVARADSLEGRPFAHIAREFDYSDYVARISATHLGRRGIRVREQYQWVPL